jgi:hypothetical protein
MDHDEGDDDVYEVDLQGLLIMGAGKALASAISTPFTNSKVSTME